MGRARFYLNYYLNKISYMRIGLRFFSLASFLLVANIALAQDTMPIPEKNSKTDDMMPDPNTMPSTPSTPVADPSRAGNPAPGRQQSGQPGVAPAKAPPVSIEDIRRPSSPPDADRPLDGVVEKKSVVDKQVLAYEPVREADVMWEKRVWRVIDIREKMNQAFSYPEDPFISILLRGIQDSSASGIKAYSAEDDKFSHRLKAADLDASLNTSDTISVMDVVTQEMKAKIVHNEFNPEAVKRYRIKELWFFDKQASVLKVRILGIAPLMDKNDEAGNFLYEQPLFWIYYPDCREYLSRSRVVVEGNDNNPISWEDLFELRRFSSYIFKESNVQNRRLKDYLAGTDILLEGEKIK